MSFTWSYSALNNYSTCPRQYHALRVEKRYKQEDTIHTQWGNDVHQAIEATLKTGVELPVRMFAYSDTVNRIKQSNVEFYSEQKLAVTEQYEACGFFDPHCWSRAIVDYLGVNKNKGLNLDFKTGRRKEGSKQLVLSTAIVFANYPQIDTVTTGFVWLQEGGKISSKVFFREDLQAMWKQFEAELRNMAWSYEYNIWPPKQSGLCAKWCPVLDCEFNGRNK